MKIDRKFAPILHTGFGDTYTREQMEKFVSWLDDMGYSGFSAEGKSAAPTGDIDGWIDGYMRGILYACEQSEIHGTDVWLFDEWGYPTGTAAGKAMKGHPEWRSKQLHTAVDMILEEGETVSITAPCHFLAAAAWPVNRNIFASPAGEVVNIPVTDGKLTYTATHRRCRFVVSSWEYDNTRTVGVFIHNQEDDTQCTLDLMSYEAVANFLSVMHEEYYSRMPEYFGKVIRGFFYDEPFLSFPLPYTFDIIEQFIADKGYDPTPFLPQLTTGGGRIRDDWRDVCTTRMARAFYGQMQSWCHAHNVELVGHQDLDHDIRSHNSVSGDFFKNNKYNDAPGVDYIWAQIRPDHTADFPRFAGSFRHMTGKAHATSESFAATGNCLTPDYIRFAMEYQAVRGIDRFYLMIADPDIESRRGYGTPFDAAHPVAANYGREINRHVNITNQMLNSGVPGAQVALYVPRREISGEYPPARPNRISLHMPWEWVNDTAEALLYAPVDFDYIWDDIIKTLPISDDGALLTPAGQKISTIIIPAVYRLDDEVAGRLREMKSRGADIIFISYASDGFVGYPVCTYPRDIGKYIAHEVSVNTGARVSLAVRRCGDGDYYFFLNESTAPYNARLSFHRDGNIQFFDYESMEWFDADTDADGVSELSLSPLEIKVCRVAVSPCGRKKRSVCDDAAEIKLYNWSALTPDGKTHDTGDKPAYFPEVGYTGITECTCRADIGSEGEYLLSLGTVCYAATVYIDGVMTAKLPFTPHMTTVKLTQGTHEIKIEVLNADAASILGTPEAELRAREQRRFKDMFENDRDYVSAGIAGPVSLKLLK